jgi:hypothetical protein
MAVLKQQFTVRDKNLFSTSFGYPAKLPAKWLMVFMPQYIW